MKSEVANDSSGNLYFAGSLLLAFIDGTGIGEYALKTAIGGAIWLAYRIIDRKLERGRERKKSGL
jgi:hypothetical protein